VALPPSDISASHSLARKSSRFHKGGHFKNLRNLLGSTGLLVRRPGTKSQILKRIILTFAAAISFVSCVHAESGMASYYGGRGRSGEMTCAHRTRPMGTMVTVTYRGRSIRCRVNDRGPFIKGRVIDVSLNAARALGMIDAGVVMVLLGVD
jgi:rare lipoprotein A